MHRIGRRHQLVVGRTDDGCIGSIRTDRGNSEHARGCGKNREVKVVAHTARSIYGQRCVAIEIRQLAVDLRGRDEQNRYAESIHLQATIGECSRQGTRGCRLADGTQVRSEHGDQAARCDRLREIRRVDHTIDSGRSYCRVIVPGKYGEARCCQCDDRRPVCEGSQRTSERQDSQGIAQKWSFDDASHTRSRAGLQVHLLDDSGTGCIWRSDAQSALVDKGKSRREAGTRFQLANGNQR